MGRHRLVEMVAAESAASGRPRRRWSTRTVTAAVGIAVGLFGAAGAWALLVADDGPEPGAGSAGAGPSAVVGSPYEVLAGAESPAPSASPGLLPTSQPAGTPAAGTRFTADYERTSHWANGFVAEVVVRNLGDRAARWTVEVALPPGASVVDVWRMEYQRSGEIVRFYPSSELAPGRSASFGFRVEARSQVNGVSSCAINGQPCT